MLQAAPHLAHHRRRPEAPRLVVAGLIAMLLVAVPCGAASRCPKGTKRVRGRQDGGMIRYCVRFKGKAEQRHGPFASYHRNGRVRSRGAYLNGQLHGR